MNANTIMDLLTFAGLLAIVAVPILAISFCAMVRSFQRCRRELVATRRRLADVEALRKLDGQDDISAALSRDIADRLSAQERKAFQTGCPGETQDGFVSARIGEYVDDGTGGCSDAVRQRFFAVGSSTFAG